MRDDKRVILVKPGDILLIGNVATKIETSNMTQAGLRPLAERVGHAVEALEKVGILAFVFAGDIEIAKVPGYAERNVMHDPTICTTCAAARLEPTDPGAHP